MNRPLTLVVSILLGVSALFLLLSLISYSSTQVSGSSPAGANLMGTVGALLAHACIGCWGVAAFYLPLVILGYSLALWREYDLAFLWRRLTGALLLLPALCGLVHLLPEHLCDSWLISWDQCQLRGLGGSLGYLLCGPQDLKLDPPFLGGLLLRWFDTAGSVLALVAVAVLAVLLMDLGLMRWLSHLWYAIRASTMRRHVVVEGEERYLSEPYLAPAAPRAKARATTSVHEITRRIAEEQALPPDASELVEKIRSHRKALEQRASDEAAPAEADAMPSSAALGAVAAPASPSPAPAQPPAAAGSSAAASVAAAHAEAEARNRPVKPRAKRQLSIASDGEYVLPPIDLLEEPALRRTAEHEQEKNQTSRAIEEVFSHFNISVQVVAATRGPVVTQYEISLLDQAMRVSKVEGFEKDLAMKLGTEGIRIVAPLPNKTTIGVEVPNRVKEQVVMRDLVD